MKRFIVSGQRALWARASPSAHRSFSTVAQSDESLQESGGAFIPKMPAFDYSPPPYTGPSAAEVLQKRQRHLNPAIFHFYKNPVSYTIWVFLIFLWKTEKRLAFFGNSDSFLPWAVEFGGWEDAVLVRRERASVSGCFWRDRHRVLRPLPPWGGRGDCEPNEAPATFYRIVSESHHSWLCRSTRIQDAWRSQGSFFSSISIPSLFLHFYPLIFRLFPYCCLGCFLYEFWDGGQWAGFANGEVVYALSWYYFNQEWLSW